jgi:hypothetical protein
VTRKKILSRRIWPEARKLSPITSVITPHVRGQYENQEISVPETAVHS